MKDLIKKSIEDSIEAKKALLDQVHTIDCIIQAILNSLKKNRKILICGNGGSAADSQHFAAELVGRYKKERKPLPAIALTTDSSILTCVSNDYSYNDVFSRQVLALANENDILIGLSTSGNSSNIVKALEAAKNRKCQTIMFLGRDGGVLKKKADYELIVRSNETARIQEVHILLLHVICQMIDEAY